MNAQSVGERLREAREQRGLSRDAVLYELRSRGMPTTTNTLARWERTGGLKVSELAMLASIYEVEPAEFMPNLEDVLAAARVEAERLAREARNGEPPAGS